MALALLDAAVLVLSVRELATRDMSLQASLFFFPAPTWVVLACAAFAVVWGVARTVWGAKRQGAQEPRVSTEVAVAFLRPRT